MGQENSSAFNCGIFERDNRSEVRGDQAMKIRKMLEQERMRYEAPSKDTETSKPVTATTVKSTPLSEKQTKSQPLFEHGSILRLSNQPFDKCTSTQHGFYEQATISLASLVESRYNTELLFPEEEVLKLAESIIYAIAYLENKGWAHHDIYPTNIFYVNGTFKLAHPRFVQTSYQLTIERKRFSFLSPELIIALRDQETDIEPELLYKSDVFSLGMTLLEFCSLKPSCEVYDQDNYDIIDSYIQDRLDAIRQAYSPKVAEVIAAMLEYEVDQRIGAIPLAKRINQQLCVINAQQETAKRVQQAVQAQGSQVVGLPQGNIVMHPQSVQRSVQVNQPPHGGQPNAPINQPPSHPPPRQMQQYPAGTQVVMGPPPQLRGPPPSQISYNPNVPQLRVVAPTEVPPEVKKQLADMSFQPPIISPAQPSGIGYAFSSPPQLQPTSYQPNSLPSQQRSLPSNPFNFKDLGQNAPQTTLLRTGEPAIPKVPSEPAVFNTDTYYTHKHSSEGTSFTSAARLAPSKNETFNQTYAGKTQRASLQEQPAYSSSRHGDLSEQYRKTSQLLARLNIESKLDSPTDSNKLSETTSVGAKRNTGEESLDERVRRILEKSKQIK